MNAPRIHRILSLLTAAVAAVPGIVALSWLYQIFAGRMTFPLDLEWMEGGVLMHALRLQQGLGIYVRPSLDFIPFLYTPGYPVALAWLGRIFPFGYTLARVVSVLAFSGVLALGAALALRPVWREAPAGSNYARAVALAIAIGAAGSVAASYTFTGAFYDLVRADSTMMFFIAGAVALAYLGRGRATAAAAGVIVACAFFTKQTAALLGVAIGVGLVLSNWRRGLIYGAAAAVALALGLAYWQWRSAGWFWTYVFELHQSHAFNKALAYRETPLRLLRTLWPLYGALVVSIAGLALGRRLERRDAILIVTALAGIVAACVGFGTQWAFDNAFIPAVIFPALATAALGARLATGIPGRLGAATLGLVVALGLGYGSLQPGRPDRQALVPNDSDHRAAGRLLQRLAALPADGFIPFHPYYAVLAGHKPFVHRMGVMDVAAKFGRPLGLDEALAGQKFDFIVLDWKSRPYEWPHLDTKYHVVQELGDGVDSVRMFSGAQTSPRQILLPIRPPPPLPPAALRRFDLEMGSWAGWRLQGAMAGDGPMPAPPGAFGRFAIDTRAGGASAKTRIESPPFTLVGNGLRFWMDGASDPNVSVWLSHEGKAVRQARAAGNSGWVQWDVDDLVGQTVSLVVQDDSDGAGIAIDEVIELGVP